MCLQALDDCHERGLVHGDIKVDNVMTSVDKSHVTLVDFGTASIRKGAQSPSFSPVYTHVKQRTLSHNYDHRSVGRNVETYCISPGRNHLDIFDNCQYSGRTSPKWVAISVLLVPIIYTDKPCLVDAIHMRTIGHMEPMILFLLSACRLGALI
jgi:serine/threonine protein kinase